jgi:hypothetical protein
MPLSTTLANQSNEHRIGLLLGIAVASVILWQTMIGSLLLYPFTILATWFHEMGHGIAAMLTGSQFERLLIFADGSGLALSVRPADPSRLASALISASGPLAPAMVGSLLMIASRADKSTRAALTGLGAALIISTVIWVRSLTGWLVLPALGIAILALARRGSERQQRFGIQVLGVQACISTWKQFDYLFSSAANIGGEVHRSDTGAIADALLLPYWFWGAAISAAIGMLLWWSFHVAFLRGT